MHTATAYLQNHAQHAQMTHWRQELNGLSQARTYRERVLANVYRQLIESREDTTGLSSAKTRR
ncbi:hypothetical protein [Allochromatium palmeri]|uniref:Uncharacterized protein n=1 Tax=Allochromatium palmeri TaxID=231048 RepID=A0A6N8EHS1_9GAMM|nr:hypothetical protein [Allochromatium palmeri]MTW23161.1 hypothetical protein [Allochromatium palmeri]